MSNLAGVLEEEGTTDPCQASGFTLGFFVWSVLLIFFSFLCCALLCLVCPLLIAYSVFPNVYFLSFLDIFVILHQYFVSDN